MMNKGSIENIGFWKSQEEKIAFMVYMVVKLNNQYYLLNSNSVGYLIRLILREKMNHAMDIFKSMLISYELDNIAIGLIQYKTLGINWIGSTYKDTICFDLCKEYNIKYDENQSFKEVIRLIAKDLVPEQKALIINLCSSILNKC